MEEPWRVCGGREVSEEGQCSYPRKPERKSAQELITLCSGEIPIKLHGSPFYIESYFKGHRAAAE